MDEHTLITRANANNQPSPAHQLPVLAAESARSLMPRARAQSPLPGTRRDVSRRLDELATD